MGFHKSREGNGKLLTHSLLALELNSLPTLSADPGELRACSAEGTVTALRPVVNLQPGLWPRDAHHGHTAQRKVPPRSCAPSAYDSLT